MKTMFLACLSLSCLAAGGTAAETTVTTVRLAQDEIEILVSPIALYPDALVALILPASTRPSDIVLASRFLKSGEAQNDRDAQAWEDSVKALTHYPEVIAYLDDNLAWTQSLGECFLAQPADVMNAIQNVRSRARSGGLLTDTAEQEVIMEEGEIRIVPAQPTVIYVPRYDPEVLYLTSARTYYDGPFLSFGIGYGIGAWLGYDCDWRYRSVRISHRAPDWYHNYNWRTRPVYSHAGNGQWRNWTPAPQHAQNPRPPHRADVVLRPSHGWNTPGQTRVESPGSGRDQRRDRPNNHPADIRREPTPTHPGAVNPTASSRPRPAVTNDATHPSRPDSRSGRRVPPERHRSTVAAPPAPAVTAAPAPALTAPSTPRPTTGTNPHRSGNEPSRGHRRDEANRPNFTPPERSVAPAPQVRAARATDDSPRSENKEDPTHPHKSGDRRDLN